MNLYFDDKPDITYVDHEHFDSIYYDMLFERDSGSLCGSIVSNIQNTNELWCITNAGYEVMLQGKSPKNKDLYIEQFGIVIVSKQENFKN